MILSEHAEAVRTMNWERGGHHQNRNGVGEVLTFGHWIVRHNGNKIALDCQQITFEATLAMAKNVS
jgi:hypothetical protein